VARYSSVSTKELIHACAETGDSEAWEEFVVRFHRAVTVSIVRAAIQWGALPQEVVDDLIQETYLKLCADKCRLLLAFSTQHPELVAGYIKTIAINVARDHFKSLNSQKRGRGETDQLLEDSSVQAQSASLGGQDAMERQILLKQINQCLETCSEGPDGERDRLIFWLYYQHGMTTKAIAGLPTVGLTPKGVESAILRLTRLVREQIVDLRSRASEQQQLKEKGFRPAESY
jgi:RNA polymerase sigma-70 factor (ECF subfamily)